MKIFILLLSAIIVIGIYALLACYPLMWLWNWLMPTIFGLPTITTTQAMGLIVLSTLLINPLTFKYSDK